MMSGLGQGLYLPFSVIWKGWVFWAHMYVCPFHMLRWTFQFNLGFDILWYYQLVPPLLGSGQLFHYQLGLYLPWFHSWQYLDYMPFPRFQYLLYLLYDLNVWWWHCPLLMSSLFLYWRSDHCNNFCLTYYSNYYFLLLIIIFPNQFQGWTSISCVMLSLKDYAKLQSNPMTSCAWILHGVLACDRAFFC